MVDWATVVASVVLSVIGSLIVTEYQLRRERSVEESVELEQWYTDGASYAAQVRRTWQRLWDSAQKPDGNPSELRNKMNLLEGQISRHASADEQMDADSDVIEALDELAIECRRPADHRLHRNSATEFQDFREDVLDAVEDVEDALEER